MSTLLFASSSLATSAIYAIPAVLALLLAWFKQHSTQSQIKRGSKTSSGIVSNNALAAYLKERGLSELKVGRHTDFTKNEYSRKTGEILLSPDTLDSVDYGSVAYALHAGAQAESARRAPNELQSVDALGKWVSIIFWILFCVLGAGLMAANLPCTIAGYVLMLIMFMMNAKRRSIISKIDEDAIHFVKTNDKLFSEEAKKQLTALLKSMRYQSM
ncbi:MAG: zinc metallopeptidase [Planctomycetia bacterium]|nr:zinc metallopeptidase [Planctomycetia bacterium]